MGGGKKRKRDRSSVRRSPAWPTAGGLIALGLLILLRRHPSRIAQPQFTHNAKSIFLLSSIILPKPFNAGWGGALVQNVTKLIDFPIDLFLRSGHLPYN